jgi:hypothetical protein
VGRKTNWNIVFGSASWPPLTVQYVTIHYQRPVLYLHILGWLGGSIFDGKNVQIFRQNYPKHVKKKIGVTVGFMRCNEWPFGKVPYKGHTNFYNPVMSYAYIKNADFWWT